MSFSGTFTTVRYLAAFAVMVVVWLTAGMVYFERFIPPFDHLVRLLMPWKKIYSLPVEGSLEQRLSIMQEILNSSNRLANIAFLALIISFVIFSVYLTYIYQQRLRKVRENKLLMLKNQEIARRNEFIRYISATIGHEFKNNLGRIKRRIDLFPGLPDDVKARIDENLEKLFADIDIFKKISDEREAVLIDFKEVDLRRLLSDIAKQYSDLAEVIFHGDIYMPTIFASETLLKTVFENLIDNAIKYKKPEQPKAKISLLCSTDVDGRRRYVSLSFRDEGTGMNEQQAEQCFYKGKRTQEGWGEGLYFAKYVIGLHAGKIRVGKDYTAPGKGTEIIISLPFVEEAIDV